MSSRKRRKAHGSKPSREDMRRARQDWDAYMDAIREVAENGMDRIRQELLDAGATDDQIDSLMRIHRCRIGYEALEHKRPDIFEFVTEPVFNELLVRRWLDVAMDDETYPVFYKEDTHE